MLNALVLGLCLSHPPVVAAPAVASWKVGPEVLILTALSLLTLSVGFAPTKVRPVLGVRNVGFVWLAPPYTTA
jgi:hypothetical protein